jgi:peptide/nickel transport system permease protein
MTATLTPTPTPAAPVAPVVRIKVRKKMPQLGWMFGVGWLAVLGFCAFAANYLPFIRTYDAKVQVGGRAKKYGLGPGWTAWFGTDNSSHDVFARCIYGARQTLIIGIGATIIGLTVGGLLGVLAGYYRGWADRVVSIVIDCLLAMPPLLLALLLIQRSDQIKQTIKAIAWLTRAQEIMITLGILSIAPFARIVRAQTLSLRERDFVLAARSVGAKSRRVIWREIMPNLVPAMVTVAVTGLGILIAAEGTLAFFGLGVERPQTWGKMIDASRDDLNKAWWAAIFPCLFLFLTVLSFNFIGDRLARKFDIREAAV